jgi:hypothetical protein
LQRRQGGSRRWPIKSSRPPVKASLPPIGQKRNNQTRQLGNMNKKGMTLTAVELIKVSLDITNSDLQFILKTLITFVHLSVEERSPNKNKLHLKDHIMYLAAKNIIL